MFVVFPCAMLISTFVEESISGHLHRDRDARALSQTLVAGTIKTGNRGQTGGLRIRQLAVRDEVLVPGAMPVLVLCRKSADAGIRNPLPDPAFAAPC
jgi:hypothetical protein